MFRCPMTNMAKMVNMANSRYLGCANESSPGMRGSATDLALHFNEPHQAREYTPPKERMIFCSMGHASIASTKGAWGVVPRTSSHMEIVLESKERICSRSCNTKHVTPM